MPRLVASPNHLGNSHADSTSATSNDDNVVHPLEAQDPVPPAVSTRVPPPPEVPRVSVPTPSGVVAVAYAGDQLELVSGREFTALVMSVDLSSGDGGFGIFEVRTGLTHVKIPLPRAGVHVEVVDVATGGVVWSCELTAPEDDQQ